MPPENAPLQSPTPAPIQTPPPKRSRIKRVIISIIGVIFVLTAFMYMTGGYGYIMVTETIKAPFRGLIEKKYKSPALEKYATVNHVMSSLQFSAKSPFVVFTEHFETGRNEDYGGARTGLFNLDTKETVILAPENGIPRNYSMFSPDGKYLLYAVARKDGEQVFTNEHGNWRMLHGFDLYVRDLFGGTSMMISKEEYPIWIEGTIVEGNFGWIDNDRFFYSCIPKDAENKYDNYCFVDIRKGSFEFRPKNLYTFDLPPELSLVKKEKLQFDNIDVDYSYSKTARVYPDCKFPVYDSCGVRTMYVEDETGKHFLYNRKQTPYILRWSHDDALYGFLHEGNKTEVYRLYK